MAAIAQRPVKWPANGGVTVDTSASTGLTTQLADFAVTRKEAVERVIVSYPIFHGGAIAFCIIVLIGALYGVLWIKRKLR
jgi:hypothetical protein